MSSAFTPWTATQQAQKLIALIQATNSGLTDFTVGSVIRSAIVEPDAITAQDLGQQIVAATNQNIEATLQEALSIIPEPARAAYGVVQWTVSTAPSANVTVPNGFTVAVPGSTLQYILGASTVWTAGSTTLSAVVTCTVPGAVGNVPANSITQIVSTVPSGLTGLTVTNPQDFTTGADAQTDLDATALVPSYMARLKAATKDAIAAKALQGVVTDASGYVTEAVGAAVSATGGYVPTPTVSPAVTASSPSTATALAAGTYLVGYTWLTPDGETPLSPTASITITAGQAITVEPLTLPNVTLNTPNATGITIYLSTAAGGTTLASVATNSPSGTVVTDAITLSALPASGAALPPTINTAFAVTAGFATCWVANDIQTPPSSDLLASAQQWVTGFVDAQGQPHPGAKAAGITTTVVPVFLATQDVTATILPLPGYSLSMIQDNIELAIQAVFSLLDIGQGITYNNLIFAIGKVPGVADVLVTTPAANVAGILGTLWLLGAVTLSLMA